MLASTRTVSSTVSPTLKQVFSSASTVGAANASSSLSIDAPAAPRVPQRPRLTRLSIDYDVQSTRSPTSPTHTISIAGPSTRGITMRDILPHRVAYQSASLPALTATSLVGLGIHFDTGDVGTVAPPPTPRFESGPTLPDTLRSPALGNATIASPGTSNVIPSAAASSVECKVLNAMPSNSLYMRRKGRKAAKLDVSSPKPLAIAPSAPASPAAIFEDDPVDDSVSSAGDVERVGLGIAGLSISRSASGVSRLEVDLDAETEWDFGKSPSLKSCKGRICTPHHSSYATSSVML